MTQTVSATHFIIYNFCARNMKSVLSAKNMITPSCFYDFLIFWLQRFTNIAFSTIFRQYCCIYVFLPIFMFSDHHSGKRDSIWNCWYFM